MSDLILEFYSEEIPSRMQKKASIDLKDIFTNGLDLAGLDYSKIYTFVTPRRLALIVKGLSNSSNSCHLLTNKGNRLTVSHKLTSSETYNTILDLRLNKIQGSYYSTTGNAGNVGGSNMYDPWSGFQVQNDEYPLLNIGLSFTTSTKVSQFELII